MKMKVEYIQLSTISGNSATHGLLRAPCRKGGTFTDRKYNSYLSKPFDSFQEK